MVVTRSGPTNNEKLDIISLKRFDQAIPDEAAAIAHVEQAIWQGTPRCGHCGSEDVYRPSGKPPMSHRCRDCQKYFSIRIGTIMQDTNLPVLTWLKAIYFIHTNRKGISSIALSKLLGVTQRTAWFLGHRIRKAMTEDDLIVHGVVEIDETVVGGKMKNMHKADRPEDPMENKTHVIGFRDHFTGKVVAFPIDDVRTRTLRTAVTEHVAPGSILYTDSFPGYRPLSKLGFDHHFVNHKVGQFVNDLATTNGIESHWALLKRAFIGTFHWMSKKHLHRYVTESSSRHNAGKGNGFVTIGKVLSGMVGRRLTWKELVAA